MSEEVGFGPFDRSSGGGTYSQFGANSSSRRVSCSKRTCIIITVVVIVIYIISVSIPASLLSKVKSEDGKKTTLPLPTTVSTTPVPEPPTTKWNRYKLPTTVKPEEYNVTLVTELDDAKYPYVGVVEILLNIVEKTDYVVLHASPDINITKVEYRSKATQNYIDDDGVILARNDSLQQIEVQFNEPLTVDKKYYIKLTFESNLNDKLNGFYKSSYKNSKNQTVTIATTQFEPIHARRAFPCFDEPAMKARFALNIARPKEWITLFNTKLNLTVDKGDGKVMDYYGFSPYMSTYLVAFIISDFKSTPSKIAGNANVEIKVWAPPDLLSQVNLAANVTGDILEKYEEFFNLSYPLNKLDLVAIPDFAAGAMENWGLITYRSQDLLYDEGVTSSYMKQRIVSVIAHELAHQWFGNLVTMNWWNELWLNEGFATYVGNFIGVNTISQKYNYHWNIEESFLRSFSYAQYTDSLHNTHALSSPENQTYSESVIEAQFDGITYLKGASLIRMVYGYVGANNATRALTNYLHKYKYKNARSVYLWDEFDAVFGGGIKDLMMKWTSQSGLPRVTVGMTNTKFTFQQDRFYLCVTCKPKPQDASWHIPIIYETFNITAKEVQDYYTLKIVQGSVPRPPGSDLIKLNTNMTGFYIVQYDLDTTKRLVSLLTDSNPDINLNSVEKGNVINDIFYNFRAGSYGEGYAEKATALLLEMINTQRESDEYLPYKFTLGVLAHLNHLFKFESEDKLNVIKPYTLNYLDVYNINITKQNIDSLDYLQKQLLLSRLESAVNIREEICKNITGLENMLQLWTAKLMGNKTVDTSSIHPDLLTIVAECSVMVGDNGVWKEILSAYPVTDSPSQKTIYRAALAATDNPELLYMYLQSSLNEDIFSRQDTASVISQIAVNKHGSLMAWSFVQEKWDILFERYGTSGSDLGRIVRMITVFSSEYMLTEVKSFFKDRAVGPAERPLAQSMEIISSNVFCKSTYGEYIIKAMSAE